MHTPGHARANVLAMCVFVHAHTRVCVSVHVCTSVRASECVSVHICVHACMRAGTSTCILVRAHACVRTVARPARHAPDTPAHANVEECAARVHTYMRACVHASIHALSFGVRCIMCVLWTSLSNVLIGSIGKKAYCLVSLRVHACVHVCSRACVHTLRQTKLRSREGSLH